MDPMNLALVGVFMADFKWVLGAAIGGPVILGWLLHWFLR
jgi:hypothetical protein